MWTTRILKSAATIAIISAFTQAHAGENATCYVVKDNKTTPVACTKNVVETHKKGPLKVCRTVDKNADSADFLNKITTYSHTNGTVIQENNTSLLCGAGGDSWNMQEKTSYSVAGKSATMQYYNLETGKIATAKAVAKASDDYYSGKTKNQPKFGSCMATSKSGESVCF